MSVDVEVLDSGELVEAVKDSIDEEESVIEAFIVGEDNEVVNPNDILKDVVKHYMKGFDSERIHDEVNNSNLIDVVKSIDGSTQSVAEKTEGDFSVSAVVEPPFPAKLMSTFLEVDETHYRCVMAKVTDSVSRPYTLESIIPVAKDNDADKDKITISQDVVNIETKIIEDFIKNCNNIIGFEGVLQRCSMDFESVGWTAIEVIRSTDMKIRRLSHIPADRVFVLRGWKGFVEDLGAGKYMYYQNFGDKVISAKRKNVVTEKAERYNPEDDGELTGANAKFSLISKRDGRSTSSLADAANEIIWMPKHHSNTIYYGYSDVVPAIGHMLANVHIRDYLLQFFDHNTVPNYAIIIKGAKLSKSVQEAITKYFSTHVKGRAHKTLIIPISQGRSEVEITFEKLSSEEKEGSFQETRKNNSQFIQVSHGVSPAILGINDTASLGSGKGVAQSEVYKDRIVTPRQKLWEKALSDMFRLGLGIKFVHLFFDPLDLRDKESESRRLLSYMDRGVLNINQVLKITGMGEPITGGDRNFIKLGNQLVFIDELSKMTGLNAVNNPELRDVAIKEEKDEMIRRERQPLDGSPELDSNKLKE